MEARRKIDARPRAGEVKTIEGWLDDHGLGKYAELFIQNEIDFDVLEQLTLEELKELGIPLGARKRILNAVAALSTDGRALPARASPALDTSVSNSTSAGEAERRQLTVMFCDLVGSVALGERMDVEDYRELLRRFRAAAVGAVEAHGGYIARHQGDGLLVYFGYPRAREDDAERAARAGLEIVAAVRQMPRPQGHELQVRVGIATGQTVVGDRLSAGGSYELGALGRTPNLAARLQSEASPGSVLVSDATAELTRGLFELEPLKPRILKGIEEPVSLYRVIGERLGATRFDARAARRLSEFVGREEELDLFGKRWLQAGASRGQVVLVVGEPGLGKSRLAGQFLQLIRGQNHLRLLLQCSPELMNSPLHPVVSYLNLALDQAGPGRHERSEQLQAWVAAELGELPGALELIGDLLSLPIADTRRSLANLEAARRRELTLAAIVHHIETLATRAPLALLVEDVHWADPSTRELLARVVQAIQDSPVLTIVTTRPGFEAEWTDAAHVRVLHLARLAAQESEALAQSAAKALATLPGSVVEEIVARAGGNPLFIEEIARSVVQRSPEAELGTSVPSTLQDSLMGRLDALELGKAVAQTASVIGREFDYGLLRGIWDGVDGALEGGLRELTADGIVYERGQGENRLYQFKHALVQDIAYASLLRERRQTLHHRVAAALEAGRPELAATQPELLARHFSAANEVPRAMEMWEAASTRAERHASHEEVIEHCEAALALIARSVLQRAASAQSIEFLLRMANSQRVLDRTEAALATLERAQSSIGSNDGAAAASQARIHYLRGNLNFTLGRTNECEAEHERALDLARAVGDREVELGALSGLGDAAYARGRMITAEALFDRMLVLGEEYGLPESRPANLSMRADTRVCAGRVREAVVDLEEGYELARARNDVRGLVLCCCSAGLAFYEIGRFADAVERGQEGAEAARALGSPNLESFMLGFHARALVAMDEPVRALESARAAIDRSAAGPAFAGAMAFGAAALAESSSERSTDYLRQGERIVAENCVSHNRFWFYADAIEVCLRNGTFTEAEQYAEKLQEATRIEPLPWAELHIERARTLARFAAGERGEALRNRLQVLQHETQVAAMERLRVPVLRALRQFDDDPLA
jgi:class 3 adenylate cyclase/tetratricopeptide (TPR) repeat protein